MAHWSLAELQEWQAQGYRFVPILQSYKGNFDPADVYERLGWQGQEHFLLESGKMGRFSFLGGEPFATLVAQGGQTVYTSAEGQVVLEGHPLEHLRQQMRLFRAPRIPGWPKFRGGAVGFFSYDLVRYFERLPERSADDLQTPDFHLLLVDQLCVIDHEARQLHLIAHIDLAAAEGLEKAVERAESKLQRWEQRLFAGASANASASANVNASTIAFANEYEHGHVSFGRSNFEKMARNASGEQARDTVFVPFENAPHFQDTFLKKKQATEWRVSFSEEAFVDAVLKVQEYIRQGDVFQVNLSVRQGRTLQAHPYAIYKHLRQINPSPYASYLHLADRQIVSCSPELLVRSVNGQVDTRPIAGTRPRTGDLERDQQAIAELKSNEKELAEHIMLVDLERNDLGRVCRYGSVEVNELMVIEEYSHVFHIVSNVRGELSPERDVFDLLQAVFPGGTITGAPKIRTMEIIEELEPTRRGLYTGAIGWIDFAGDLELNIVIRTLLVQDGVGYVQAGAGIVIDSLPEREYHESLRKAKALWVAIEQAEQAAKKEGEPA